MAQPDAVYLPSGSSTLATRSALQFPIHAQLRSRQHRSDRGLTFTQTKVVLDEMSSPSCGPIFGAIVPAENRLTIARAAFHPAASLCRAPALDSPDYLVVCWRREPETEPALGWIDSTAEEGPRSVVCPVHVRAWNFSAETR